MVVVVVVVVVVRKKSGDTQNICTQQYFSTDLCSARDRRCEAVRDHPNVLCVCVLVWVIAQPQGLVGCCVAAHWMKVVVVGLGGFDLNTLRLLRGLFKHAGGMLCIPSGFCFC